MPKSQSHPSHTLFDPYAKEARNIRKQRLRKARAEMLRIWSKPGQRDPDFVYHKLIERGFKPAIANRVVQRLRTQQHKNSGLLLLLACGAAAAAAGLVWIVQAGALGWLLTALGLAVLVLAGVRLLRMPPLAPPRHGRPLTFGRYFPF